LLLVPKDVEYVGDINTSSNLQVEGTVRGRIRAASVYVAPDAEVEGSVLTLRAAVRGRILGDVFVAGALVLDNGGYITGNVRSRVFGLLRLSVQRWLHNTKETFFPHPGFLVTVISASD
jgi:cytoskeletal protein CcmA (bactofilin family)